MADQQHVVPARLRQAACQDPIGPLGHLVDCLASGPGSIPDGPTRELLDDVGGESALELAVVPLAEIGISDRHVTEPGQSSGIGGTGKRAGQDERELLTGQPATDHRCLLPPHLGERDIGATGVTLQARPFRLTMADQPDPRFGAAHEAV